MWLDVAGLSRAGRIKHGFQMLTAMAMSRDRSISLSPAEYFSLSDSSFLLSRGALGPVVDKAT